MKVYLYELDSVRKTPAEIQIAQERLFKETVGNGNTVVLSANQLLDGRGFTEALYGKKGEENYQTILRLFQTGLVKVCKFTNYNGKGKRETDPHTKYQKVRKFVLPASNTVPAWRQPEMVKVREFARPGRKNNPAPQVVVESLAEYQLRNMRRKGFVTSGVKIDQEGKRCMEEALAGDKPYILDKWVKGKTRESEKRDAEYVQRVTKLIYELGMYDIWEEEDTEIKVTFESLMNYILRPMTMGVKAQKQYNDTIKDCPEILCAIGLLHKLDKTIESRVRNRRSPWREPKEKLNPTGFTIYKTASAEDKANAQIIIDLCYNIAVESGIAGISVEYGTPHRTGKKGTRLSGQQIQEIREEQCVHLLKKIKEHVEDRQSAPAEITREQIELPLWGDALDVIEETDPKEKRKKRKSRKTEEETPFPPPPKNQPTTEKQKKRWNKKFSKLFWKRIGHLAICAIGLYAVGWFVGKLETCVSFWIDLLQQNIAIPSVKNVGSCVWSALIILIIVLRYPLTYLFTYFCDWFAHSKIFHIEEDAVETFKKMATLFWKRRKIKKYLKRIHTDDEKDADQP